LEAAFRAYFLVVRGQLAWLKCRTSECLAAKVEMS